MASEELDPLMAMMLKENKAISKHIIIGLTRLIILWKISKGKIHGYGLMKTVDEFFEEQIKLGIVKKANPSKIYPTLKNMEKNEVIKGDWEIQNNKNIKVYMITEKGELLLETMSNKLGIILKKPLWQEFIKDLKIKY